MTRTLHRNKLAGFSRIEHDEPLSDRQQDVSGQVRRVCFRNGASKTGGTTSVAYATAVAVAAVALEHVIDRRPLHRGYLGPERDHERPIHVRAERVAVAAG